MSDFHEVTIGQCRLILADCMDVLPTLSGVDAVVTDPPYGIRAPQMTLGAGKKDFFRGEWDGMRPDVSRFPDIARTVCIWGGNYFAHMLPITNDWLVWHKVNDGRSFSECELAWTNAGRQVRHLSHHWAGEEKHHPTQKPLAVMEWSLDAIDAGETVFDPFMGSGTTGVACIRTGRQFVGIEKEPKYFDIACKRIRRAWQDKQSEIKWDEPVKLKQLDLIGEDHV